MSDVILKDGEGTEQTYENINAVLLNTTDGGEAVYREYQTDYEQPDETAPDYMKNRPFGDTAETVYQLTKVECAAQTETNGVSYSTGSLAEFTLTEGSTYIVSYDGVRQEMVCKKHTIEDYNGSGTTITVLYFGNLYPLLTMSNNIVDTITDTGEDFLIGLTDTNTTVGAWIWNETETTKHWFGVYLPTGIETIDPKYLPEGVPYENGEQLLEYTESSAYTVQPEQNGLVCSSAIIGNNDFVLTEGETYYITVDGATYTCVCQQYTDPNSREWLTLGNLYKKMVYEGVTDVTITDSGEPFTIGLTVLSDEDETVYVATCAIWGETEAVAHSTGIYHLIELKKLDKKFLPDDYVPEDLEVDWENIQNNPFSVTVTDIIPEREFTVTSGADSVLYAELQAGSLSFESGKTYTVVYDGTSYVCTGQVITEGDLSALGRVELAAGSEDATDVDADKPFCLFYNIEGDSGTVFGLYTNDTVTEGTTYTHTLRVYTEEGTSITYSPEWEDVKNKPFYESVETVNIVPKQDFTLTYNAADGETSYYGAAMEYNFVVGNTYTVVWDGVTYECVAEASGVADIGMIGDANGLTDPPFLMANDKSGLAMGEPTFMIITGETGDDGATFTHSVQITGESTVLKKIDPLFLPLGKREFDDTFAESTVLYTRSSSEGSWYVSGGIEVVQTMRVPIVGNEYIVTINGETHKCIAKVGGDEFNFASIYLGNHSIYNSNYEDTGESFYISYVPIELYKAVFNYSFASFNFKYNKELISVEDTVLEYSVDWSISGETYTIERASYELLPFYDMPSATLLTWDGDTTDKLTLRDTNDCYYTKVSDEVYTKTDLLGKHIKFNGELNLLTSASDITTSEGTIIGFYMDSEMRSSMIRVQTTESVETDYDGNEVTITVGTYFISEEELTGGAVEEICETYSIPIKDRFLPQNRILPLVTTEDNGKILEVVNGQIQLVKFEDSQIKAYIDSLLNTTTTE